MPKLAGLSVASRIDDIEPFYVVDVLTRAKQLAAAGRDIVHMEAGEPDFPTILPIIDGAKKALDQGATYYTDALGIWPLRQAISDFYQSTFNVLVDPKRIIITPGASGALQLCALTLLNPGDGMLLTDPGYPCNRQFVRLAGGEPQLVEVKADDHFQLTAHALEQAWQPNTVAAMVASPSNPTGTSLSEDALTQLVTAVAQKEGVLIVDELYQMLSFNQQPQTVLNLTQDAFVVNSFSKFFGMTGWRLGWMVVPEAAIEPIEKLAQNLFISLSTPAQYGALEGFKPASIKLLEERREIFKARCDFLLPALKAMGFEVPCQPDGAFYIYADASRFTDDSFAFCHELLEQTGVAVTPGKDFGVNGANTHVRFSFTTSLEQLKEGVKRLGDYLR